MRDVGGVARPVVCIVGAGTAGLEALLSAREALGASVDLRLVAPDREFRYRPMHHDSLFRPARERGIKVAELVAEAGATWVRDRAEVVRESERCLLTRDGDTVEFDYLLLAPRANDPNGRWPRGICGSAVETRASSTRSFGRSRPGRSRASRSLSRAAPAGRCRRMNSRWFSPGQRRGPTPRSR